TPTVGVALSLNGLGEHNHTLGNYQESARYFGEALEILTRLLPKGHPDILMASVNRAAAYYANGDFEKAAGIYASLIELQSRYLGNESAEVALSYGNL